MSPNGYLIAANLTHTQPFVQIRQNSPEKMILPKLKSTPGPLGTSGPIGGLRPMTTSVDSRKRKQPLQSLTAQNKSVKTERPNFRPCLSTDGTQHLELVNR